MFTRYGKSWSPYRDRCLETREGAYHLGVSSSPYNTLCQGGCRALFCVGQVPGTVVLTCEPCLAFLRMPFGSFQEGIPGRMVPSRFWCASRRIAMSRVFYEPRSETWGWSRRQSSGQDFRVEAV